MSLWKILVVIVLGMTITIHAQNGYKNFDWGEDYKSVQNKSEQLILQEYNVTDYKILFIPYYIQNNKLYSWGSRVPNPIKHIQGNLQIYKEEKTGRLFFFRDSQLFAVRLKLTDMNLLKKLLSKYGQAEQGTWSDGYWNYDIRAWFNKSQTMIVYQANSYLETTERVTYLDKSCYQEVASHLVAERKAEIKKAEEQEVEQKKKSIDLLD